MCYSEVMAACSAIIALGLCDVTNSALGATEEQTARRDDKDALSRIHVL
jgi:hypothetical protein